MPNTAMKVRLEKEQHPERFCPDKGCLWRTHPAGQPVKPCPKHLAYHSNHVRRVVGCDRCDDALDEAREAMSEFHVGIDP